MDPPSESGSAQQEPATSVQPPDSVTRGFLFSDLRAYTDFVERHGAASAASLLDRYRKLVRQAIERFGGAEIKTEGDSFYVVFSSVSNAVRCALVITANAIADATDNPNEPIKVGIGVHAGETIETAEGYVGSPVNIAARICSQAGPNEVLVSETVRSLTRSLLPVRFEPRGRRQLKGIAEPVSLLAVFELAPGAVPWAPKQPRILVGGRRAMLAGAALGIIGLGVASALVFAALAPASNRSGSPTPTPAPAQAAALPPGNWKIGLDMPLSGDEASRGVPVRNAVQMAIDDFNTSNGIGGWKLALVTFDDAVDTRSGQDVVKGAANAQTMVGDPSVVGMVGPWFSSVGAAIIPITNAAGLFECSPANSDPALTKPGQGALEIRKSHPERINYVRLPPADDIQAKALASFAFDDLNAKVALVIDDGEFGAEIAQDFADAFQHAGGTVARQTLRRADDPKRALAPLSAGTDRPTLVFFGGITETGAARLRLAMHAMGEDEIPLLSWDGLLDGSGADPGSYIQQVGKGVAVGTYVSHASLPDSTADFAQRYKRTFNVEPDEYAAAAYACVQVIVESLRKVASQRPTANELREALRSWAVDPAHSYQTVLGTLSFDANGDTSQQFVTFYRVETSAAGGKGDWVFDAKHDYGPAPP